MSENGSAPPERLFGKETEAALANFDLSRRPVPARLVHAIAEVKAAAALANAEVPDESGVYAEMASAIVAAAEAVARGDFDDQFPIDRIQTGSGTSTHMNVNEVISHLASASAGSEVHPNDHVNASQSTNDVFPTATRIAVLANNRDTVVPALQNLETALGARARDLQTVVKAGRTHLRDATPVTLGQEFDGYRAQIRESIERLQGCAPRLAAIPLGGTATGNGLNAPRGFKSRAVELLARRTGLELIPAESAFAAQGAQDAVVEYSAQLRGAAIALYKIAGDLRLLSSGPRTGLAEIAMPELQAGSSIMPGKVNPVICEAVQQAAAQILGHDATIAFAGTQGNLELNTFLPLIATNALDAQELLARAASSLADKTVKRLTADPDRCREYAEKSPAIATALNPHIGYEAAAEVVREALDADISIQEAVVRLGLIDEAEADRLLDVDAMARGMAGRAPTDRDPDQRPGPAER